MLHWVLSCNQQQVALHNMSCVSVALVTGQARRMRRIILWAVTCTAVPHFYRLSGKRLDLKIFEN